MPRFKPAALRRLGAQLFEAAGAPKADAVLVADHLVESGLLGHDTHSVLRFPQYVDMVRDGTVTPGAVLQVLEQTPSTAQVSGGWNYGPVTATGAMELAIEKARTGAMAAVGVQNCNHIARLGRFAALAAKQQMIGLIVSNGHGGDLAVAPLGGRQRRLPTNPLCVAVPTRREWPIVLDMTTSASSGGALRLHRNLGTPAPADSLIDAEGRPTRDVEDYYGPPQGSILPLGFPLTGHKGFGLSVMVDIAAGLLSGAGCSQQEPPRSGNALFIVALQVEALVELEDFFNEVDAFIEYLKGCPTAPGVDEIMLPGEKGYHIYQQRSREGLMVDEHAWGQIQAVAGQLAVELPAPIGP